MITIVDIRTVKDICRTVSQNVYAGNDPPLADYAYNAERLLFMTAAHESGGFRYRRQLGKWEWDKGAFGLWQVEWGSMETSIRWMLHREIFDRVREFWFAQGFNVPAAPDALKRFVIEQPQDIAGDLIGCTMARVHYLRSPGMIPDHAIGMAAYAKAVFNTRLGKATREDYLEAYSDWSYA